jgi:hypothetical protein
MFEQPADSPTGCFVWGHSHNNYPMFFNFMGYGKYFDAFCLHFMGCPSHSRNRVSNEFTTQVDFHILMMYLALKEKGDTLWKAH